MNKLWEQIRLSRDDDEEEMMALNVALETAIIVGENQPRRGGSHPGRRPNAERLREEIDKGLLEDYFVQNPVFTAEEFRTRFRMSSNLFKWISTDLFNYNRYWVKNLDCTKKVGLLPEQKMTVALKMLAYGVVANQCTEYCRTAKPTGIETLQRFTTGICNLYGQEHLQAPTPVDLRKLLTKTDRSGFPGMIGNIDCMRWQWKNCSTAWAGEYSGRTCTPTIILETVVSYDIWIWHAFFGMPGACNDMHVFAKSSLFDEITNGCAPHIQFQVNNARYNLGYYLADGI